MTCFLGDTITLTHGCLTKGFAGSLPETPGIPHLHYLGKMGERNSYLLQPDTNEHWVLLFSVILSIPALADIIGTVTSNLLLFLLHPDFHIYSIIIFMSHAPSFLLPSSHRLSTLGRIPMPLAKVHLLACSCTSISILKYTCNLKCCSYISTLADAASSSREVAGALTCRASRFCWNAAIREGNAFIFAKSQLQVWESLFIDLLCRSGAHHSACSYLPERTDSQCIWRNWGRY